MSLNQIVERAIVCNSAFNFSVEEIGCLTIACSIDEAIILIAGGIYRVIRSYPWISLLAGILQGPPCIANRCDSGGENDPNCGNLLTGSLAPIRVSSASASLQMSRSLREDWSLDDDDVDPRKIGNGAGAAGWACDQDGKWIKTDSECKHRSIKTLSLSGIIFTHQQY